ncbi:hypothetical protein I5G59_gp70 [Mycobacterium phage LilMcDreamy]|uniref:Uncharacterized protein n=1 Tax=Mycobacterium phage LilMcDreamy TaxID=2652422 RepID=A0A5P8D9C2_9CAUD|nr:hypothetical protein I5G59_gp70 [Mycobacterium phage LilMcDreamy]QFP94690.1 hypothetical protein SEA_LILMCDREAMY_70 [Mycobacterium phage LilMcDreamy]
MTTAETTGPTSAIDEPSISHTSELVERHRITIPEGAVGDPVAVARLHAEAYARARGFELRPGSLQVLMRNSTSPFREPTFMGVAFDVVVGKGDLHLDQRTPGKLDRWRWSGGAFDWWRDIFNRADGREGRLLTLVDDNGRRRQGRITGIRPGPIPGTASLEGEFTDGLSPNGFAGFGNPKSLGDPTREPGTWAGPDALRGEGLDPL